jgi:hypothetical protein
LHLNTGFFIPLPSSSGAETAKIAAVHRTVAAQRVLNSNVPLVPPKPKEFESTQLNWA